MRKQRSPCTLSSYTNLSEWQMSSPGSCNYETESYSNSFWTEFLTVDSNQISNAYEGQYDYIAAGDMPSQNFYHQNTNYLQATPDDSYVTYTDPWNYAENFPFYGPSINEPYILPIEDNVQFFAEGQFQQSFLQYGIPTVTDYGTVALLLRHLIRIDLTPDGSVSVYNFPAKCITTLNITGTKCYVKHPNGRVFQEGPIIHMMIGSRLVKISPRGITFSSTLQSLAYVVDESGTKTTTAKFKDLSNDLTATIFYDENRRSYEDLEQESYRMVAEATYQKCPDGSELWLLGRIRVTQDRWGQVSVNQNDSQATITTSPTIRRVSVESPSVSINIDCYSKNYFAVRKDSCTVKVGYCGLIVQNQSQKAGIDRNGRLVLF